MFPVKLPVKLFLEVLEVTWCEAVTALESKLPKLDVEGSNPFARCESQVRFAYHCNHIARFRFTSPPMPQVACGQPPRARQWAFRLTMPTDDLHSYMLCEDAAWSWRV